VVVLGGAVTHLAQAVGVVEAVVEPHFQEHYL
jgi:hypothetical protein